MKTKMRHLLYLVILLVLFSSCGGGGEDPISPGETPGGTTKPEIPDKEGMNVKGAVYDENNKPLANVVVSDGLKSTQTNSQGHFYLASDLKKRHFIQVSIPSGYSVPVVNGLPIFYKAIPKNAKSVEAVFNLKKINSPDRYTIIMSGDPQIRSKGARSDKLAYHSIDMMYDMFEDMNNLAKTITDRPCYGICLGDMVHNDMDMYSEYCNGLKALSYPTFHIIGNHDHRQDVASDAVAMEAYEKYLGPASYSFNLGKLHYVVVDNIIMNDNSLTAGGKYGYGLTNDVLEWLKEDMSYVNTDKTIMACAHANMYQGTHNDPIDFHLNANAYSELLSKYKYVHSWSGHNHCNFNYVYSNQGGKFTNVEQHIVARATGVLWLNEKVNSDGAPRGYYVVDIDGENISWYYKPITIEEKKPLDLTPEYQIRAYKYDDGYVYANVWAYDAKWGNIQYTDAGKTSSMEKAPSYDKMWDDMRIYYNNKYKGEYVFDDIRDVDHMFRVKPSSGATSATISVTDRFGKTYSTTLQLN